MKKLLLILAIVTFSTSVWAWSDGGWAPSGGGITNPYTGDLTITGTLTASDFESSSTTDRAVYGSTSKIGFSNFGTYTTSVEGVSPGTSTAVNGAGVLAVDGRIYTAGNIGIGFTTVPSSYLDVGGGARTRIDGVNDVLVKGDVEVDANLYVDGSIYGRGNLGIGTAVPGALLDVGGFTKSNVLSALASGFKGDVEVDGKIYADGGIYFANTSGYLGTVKISTGVCKSMYVSSANTVYGTTQVCP